MSMILFNEVMEMLNGAVFRIRIKIVLFQFFERTGALSVVRVQVQKNRLIASNFQIFLHLNQISFQQFNLIKINGLIV